MNLWKLTIKVQHMNANLFISFALGAQCWNTYFWFTHTHFRLVVMSDMLISIYPWFYSFLSFTFLSLVGQNIYAPFAIKYLYIQFHIFLLLFFFVPWVWPQLIDFVVIWLCLHWMYRRWCIGLSLLLKFSNFILYLTSDVFIRV